MKFISRSLWGGGLGLLCPVSPSGEIARPRSEVGNERRKLNNRDSQIAAFQSLLPVSAVIVLGGPPAITGQEMETPIFIHSSQC
jgi:hypothetical protein